MTPPENQDQVPAWYLDVNGKPVGPYTAEQLREFFAKGQVKSFHQVSAAHLNGQWISVQELIDSLASQAAPKKSAEFHPPPRPSEPEQSTPVIRDETDPAMSLFTALQASKERKVQTPTAKLETSSGSFLSEIPSQVWLAIGLILALGVIGSSVFKFLNNKPEVAGVASVPKVKTAAAPAPVTPPPANPTLNTVTPIAGFQAGKTQGFTPVQPQTITQGGAIRQNPPPILHPPAVRHADERDDHHNSVSDRDREDRDRDEKEREEREREDRARGDDRDTHDNLSNDIRNDSAGHAPVDNAPREGLEPAPGPRPVQPITIDRSAGAP